MNNILGEKTFDLCKCEQYDLIHIHDAYFAEVAYMLKYRLDIPLVSTIHSMTAGKTKIMFHLRKFLMENSNHVIAVSEWLGEKIKQQSKESSFELSIVEPDRNLEFLEPHSFGDETGYCR